MNNKMNTKMYSFDIAFYSIKEEVVKENNFNGRYKHCSININNAVYVIGGYDSIKKLTQAKQIYSIRYDNIMHKYNEIEIRGPLPNDIIDPIAIIHDRSTIIVYSGFKNNKIFIYNILTKISNLITIDSNTGVIVSYFNSTNLNNNDLRLKIGYLDRTLKLKTEEKEMNELINI